MAFSSGCHSRLIGTFVELFGRTRHHVLLTHPLGCTYPRFDAVGLLRADNHPLSVAVSTEATASAPIVGYPTAEEADKWLVEYTKVGGGCRGVQGYARVAAELVPLNCFQNKLPVDRLCGLAQKKT